MILLLQNSQEYNNDLRAMIMAFYPGVKIVEKQEDGQEYIFTFDADESERKYPKNIRLSWDIGSL